ncbi:MAG TPA: hypothetical protein VFH39_02700 [Candidatus Saccharimonadales bacterium]|nr:hypothetical protein [Candidatus Saccharimonadales bacterium]
MQAMAEAQTSSNNVEPATVGFPGDFVVMGVNDNRTEIHQIVGLAGLNGTERQRRMQVASDQHGRYLRSENIGSGEADSVMHSQSIYKNTGRAAMWQHIVTVGDNLPKVAKIMRGSGHPDLQFMGALLDPPDGTPQRRRVFGLIKQGRERHGRQNIILLHAFASRPAPLGDGIGHAHLRAVELPYKIEGYEGEGQAMTQFDAAAPEPLVPYTRRPTTVRMGHELTESMQAVYERYGTEYVVALGGVSIKLGLDADKPINLQRFTDYAVLNPAVSITK